MTVISNPPAPQATAAPAASKQSQSKRRSSKKYQPATVGSHNNPVEIVDSNHAPFATLDVRGKIFYMVPHGAKFVVKVLNPFPHDKCSFRLEIDGIGMGAWVLKPGATGYFERPVKVNQCFTFLSTPLVAHAEEAADKVMNDSSAIYDPMVQQALLSAPLGTGIMEDNLNNGQIKCTFTPEVRNEKRHHHHDIPVNFRKKGDVASSTMKKLRKPYASHTNDSLTAGGNGRKNDISQSQLYGSSRPVARLPSSCRDMRSSPVSSRSSSSSSMTAASSLKKKKSSSTSSSASSSTRQRRSSSCLAPAPGSTLTPGASTLQGHSSQVFGRTSLLKDPSRAVTFIVNLLASVPAAVSSTASVSVSVTPTHHVAVTHCLPPPPPAPCCYPRHHQHQHQYQHQSNPPPVPLTMAETTMQPSRGAQIV